MRRLRDGSIAKEVRDALLAYARGPEPDARKLAQELLSRAGVGWGPGGALDPEHVRCPDCEEPLRLVDNSVRVGSGSVENASWKTGYLFECSAGHGTWHLLEGGKRLTR